MALKMFYKMQVVFFFFFFFLKKKKLDKIKFIKTKINL
jgi:hypothetical protein